LVCWRSKAALRPDGAGNPLATFAAFAQQPKFELADVHVSSTARVLRRISGGVLRAERYVNRDATMLNLITAAYDVSEDAIAGGPDGLGPTCSMWSPVRGTSMQPRAMLPVLIGGSLQLVFA